MSCRSEPRHPGKVFVSVNEVAGRLADYQVFDARYSLTCNNHGEREYAKSRLPSASFADVDKDLSGPIVNTTARHPLPDACEFVEWCRLRGVGCGRPVLCYDDQCGAMGACRMWWMLHALGVEAYVLNGGFQAYTAAGLPLETGVPTAKWARTQQWPYRTVFSRALAIDDVPPNAVVVDTRPVARFASTVRPYGADTLPGHIENALSLPWDVNIVCDENNVKFLRPWEECRSNVRRALCSVFDAGHSDLSNCVFYCGSGVTAAFNIALVCHLGYGEPYLYCGSWSEYAGRFAASLARHIVNEYGMLLKMISPSFGDRPKATMDDTVTILVDEETVEEPDEDVKAALAHMHIGEKAQVFFRSNRLATIEVLPGHQQKQLVKEEKDNEQIMEC